MTTTAIRIYDGSNNELRGPAFDVPTVQGWENVSGYRGSDLLIPGVDGALHRPDKPRAAKDFEIPLVVFGVDRVTGLVSTSPAQHVRDNLDWLLGLAIPVGAQASIRKVLDVDPAREILAELADGVDVGPYGASPVARALVLRFRASTPYWRELPALAAGSPPTYTPGGNAPVTDAVLTFTGGSPARLTNNTTGDWVELSSATPAVTVDVGARTVVQSGSSALDLFTRNRRRWMTFVPGSNSLTLTGGGTVSIAAYRKWHT